MRHLPLIHILVPLDNIIADIESAERVIIIPRHDPFSKRIYRKCFKCKEKVRKRSPFQTADIMTNGARYWQTAHVLDL